MVRRAEGLALKNESQIIKLLFLGPKVELVWDKILKKHIKTINLLGRFPPNHSKLKTVDYSRVKRLSFVDDVLFNSKILISTLSLPNDSYEKDENNLFDSYISTDATVENMELCSSVIDNETILIDEELVTISDYDDQVDKPLAKVLSEKELDQFLGQVGISSNLETSSVKIDKQLKKCDVLDSKDFFIQEFKLIFSRIKVDERQNCYLAMVKLLNQFESLNCKNHNIV